MGGQFGFVRFFDGEIDALPAVGQEQAQLVFGGDGSDLLASLMEGGEDRRGAQEAGVVHHHFLLRVDVVVEIAGNAVYGWRRTGDDGDVVGIGERGNRGVYLAVDAALDDRTEIGHLSGSFVEVGLGAAVEADADDGFFARAIAPVIDLNHARGSMATRMCWRVSAKAMACASSARAKGSLTSDEYG